MLSRLFAFFALFLFLTGTAHAADTFSVGAPIPWGLDLQQAFSPVKHRMHDFHDFMLVIITGITLFVMCLLIFVILRFNAKANPKPANFAHNTLLEVVWTAIPVLILVIVGIPSMQLLYYVDKTPNPELTLKVTAHQWYWSYELPDQKVESFDSRPIWDGTKQTKEQIDAAIKDASPNWIYTMIRPCAVTSTFHIWPSATICRPGFCNSIRMMTENKPPIKPAMMENSKYSVPISLWLVEQNQRVKKLGL